MMQQVAKHIAPSLFCADPWDMREQIQTLEEHGVRWYHIDIMDGTFVRNFALGCEFTRKLKAHVKHALYFHLMAVNPLNHVETLRDAGADALAFHIETVNNPFLLIDKIKKLGMQAGVAINPFTPIQTLEPIIDVLDHVTLMSMEPGFLGQPFMPAAYDRITALRELIKKHGSHALIEIDGAVNPQIGANCMRAGADVLVAGFAFVFDRSKPIEQHYLDFARFLEQQG